MEITRREAIIRMALLMGATAVGPRLLAADFGKSAAAATDYTADDLALLDEIGETIIPATDVPGAKAVGIGAFMAMMIGDCYSPENQQLFRAGLAQIAVDYRTKFGQEFIGGAAADRTAFLNALDAERMAAMKAVGGGGPQVSHYFQMMKDLTILGYFTSEVACTQLLGWVEVPGHFDGNVLYERKPQPAARI